LRAKEEEEDDELADKREEDALLWLSGGFDGPGRKKRDKDDADPWKQLERKRREEGETKPRSLQDVVLAPPVLKPLKAIFKEKTSGNRIG
jgi:hypothetical protein